MCVHAVIMIFTYLLFSSVKPCVVLSLQSRTPALVFECINNTDFKVLKFGRHHTCWTTSTVAIHAKSLISIINNTHNTQVNVVHVLCWFFVNILFYMWMFSCCATGALPEADRLWYPLLHVWAAQGKNYFFTSPLIYVKLFFIFLIWLFARTLRCQTYCERDN